MIGPGFSVTEALNQKKVRLRTRIVTLVLGIWAAGLLGRLVQLQVFSHDRMQDQVTDQSQAKIKVLPERGSIFDRNGRILAQTVPVPSVGYHPATGESLDEKMAPVKRLAPILGLDRAALDSIRASLEKGRKFIYLKRKTSPETAARVKALDLNGVSLQDEPRRVYPQGPLAAHVLGGVDIDNQGLAGIELKYNEDLRGQEGWRLVFRDSRQRAFGSETLVPPSRGRDIVLTLDTVVQYIAQRELERAVAETRSAWGAVVVSDPSTGEVLAMASAPHYDPNTYPPTDPNALYDRAIRTIFEPGSTFKIVTAAAALEHRRVGTHESFDCRPGAVATAGGAIRDHKPFGILSFPEVISNSSNVGTIQIGRRVGSALLYQSIRDFGFGARTGIDLPAEERGLLSPPDKWSRRSLDSLSVGYEVAATAVQILQSVNIVAARGLRIPLRIVRTVDGRPVRAEEEPPVRVISAPTAEKLIDILERVVLEGTGTAAAAAGYAVAGKTGTSQKYDPSSNGYTSARHLASFVGFVPTDHPVLSIVVVLDEPKTASFYGSQVAAPLFREIAIRSLRHLHVFPGGAAPAILAARGPQESGR